MECEQRPCHSFQDEAVRRGALQADSAQMLPAALVSRTLCDVFRGGGFARIEDGRAYHD